MLAVGGAAREPMDLDDDIPELPPLELDHRGSRSAGQPASGLELETRPRQPAAGGGVQLETDDGGIAPDIALASVAPPPSAAAARGPALEKEATPKPAAAAPATASAAVARPPLDVDPVDVLVLADYGPPPTAWFQTPLYALRVLTRRRELERELVRQRTLVADAEDRVVEQLARSAEALRGRIDAAHPAAALFGTLGRYDELTHSRATALNETSRQYAEQLAQVDERTASEEEQRGRLASLVQDAELELGRLSAERARADAKIKRLDIELRSAHEAARIAAGPDAKFAPPEHAHRIAALEAEKAARTAELAPVLAAWTEAAELVRRRQADEREARKKVGALRDERKRIEQAAERQLEVRSEGARQAERDRLAAYADVTRAVLAQRPDDLTGAERAEVAASEKLLLAKEHDLELHLRALDAADGQALRQGIVLLVAAAVLALLLGGAMIVRSGSAASAPSPRSTTSEPASTR
jgi:hypothetical protein